MKWAKYTVTGHECYSLPYGNGRETRFYATTLQSAQAFQRYWGGEIKAI